MTDRLPRTGDGQVLVLRGSHKGQTWGMGACDAFGRPFQFPAVGECFEAPGPELQPIPRCPTTEQQGDLHEHGIHAFAWGEYVATEDVYRWRSGDWLVLAVAEADIVLDKGRVAGKCRVKRGVVAYIGELPSAIDFMRARWPADDPAPAWEQELAAALAPPRRDIALAVPRRPLSPAVRMQLAHMHERGEPERAI